MLSTWLHGWLFQLGRILGSDNLGVFFYIVLQFIVCAWVFGQAAAFAGKLGCSRGVQYAVTAFFALNPIWGVFIQTQVKDTLYTGLFVLFVLKTADLLLFPQEWQGSRKRLAAYAALGILCCLLRKNGIYAVVPMLLASALVLTGKQLRKPLLAVMLAVVIGSFGFDVFTEKVLDIPAGSVGEPSRCRCSRRLAMSGTSAMTSPTTRRLSSMKCLTMTAWPRAICRNFPMA